LATRHQLTHVALVEQSDDTTDVEVVLAVVGAHRLGQPLHYQLAELGAELLETRWTASTYRLVALPGSPERQGLVRVPDTRACIELELYRLPTAQIGSLLARIPAPLGLGTVELDTSRSVIGFLCQEYAARTAIDTTSYGTWRPILPRSRPWLTSCEATPPGMRTRVNAGRRRPTKVRGS
jgi:allophanate hydrolase